ncbi:nuclease-related domain-containing protein [Oleiagrimonas sp. MCCC 1A03011]|uniref:nuclease-related domain-containing protein n=1 Tax=Oleiagrimonas sp. MCCC 1A03011 TaxID=1926883 RepID=UPI000DC28084|nr:nuclease-related domain-containing protein [Oleiagrimonas sp. MCCC 1A03011]RAP55701.1 prepilin peptidase [Oleiagrimonas sp. MCCC 1A03011]
MKKPPHHPKTNPLLTTQKASRPEQEVLDELQALCTKPGYVHAVAALCFRDNMLVYTERLTEADMRDRFDSGRLIRTEINTLLGLLLKAPIDWTLPSPDVLGEYISGSDRLLLELHDAMSGAFSLGEALAALKRGEDVNPFDSGGAMREPIFYAAQSAYNFQYLDLASQRYAADAEWLQANVGFTIMQASAVADAVDELLMDRFPTFMDSLRALPPDQWTMVPAFSVTPTEVAAYAGLEPELVERILLQFTAPDGDANPRFVSLQDFNQITATPLLRLPSGEFLSLQNYALAEAIYDSPFYWMQHDKGYRSRRDKHRGTFTENFVAKRLEAVFGADRVFTNIDIWQSKTKVAEIDVLVLWADRAIIVQAKAKRLTVEGRKGNDQVIRDDFKKGIQDAYDQGLTCAECLVDPRYRFICADGSSVDLPDITEIFMFCVVSDHYPALSFQTRQFLKTREIERVRAALVCDVFLIDVLTELLPTPLQFLSYIARRTRYADRLLAAQELTIFAYHLKHNLWLEDATTMLHLAEDFTAGLDIAMAARRRGIDGDATPEGFMTRFEGKTLGRIVQEIERRPEPAVLDQGFQLLEMSGDAFDNLSRIVDRQAHRAAQDGKPHDVAMMFDDASGLTIMCSGESDGEAAKRLAMLCTLRKYRQKANRWFGICLTPGDAQLRFGLHLSDPWEQDHALDKATADMIEPMSPKLAYERAFRGGRRSPKIGRNDPCPCGSGYKYKKCCINK